MAKIFGNLRPQDDYPHPLGPEPNFNESMYFNFFDRDRSVGGFLRLGNRANEGHAEATVTLFLPDGRVLFAFKRAEIDHNDAFDAGGVRFDVLEPGQKLRTRYRGRAIALREPRQMTDPGRALRENPAVEITVDLVHDAVGPMYGSAGQPEEAARSEETQFARAHYEQHMAVQGHLDVAGDVLKIDGFGLRDHSWGPRSWQAIESYQWLTMNFGADLGAMISIIQRGPGEVRRGGVLVRGQEIDPIQSVEVEADYEEGGLFHRAVRARFETRGGERHEVSGAVIHFIPLRNRRGGRTTHIGEGMTEWRMGDRVGYGLSEFLRQR